MLIGYARVSSDRQTLDSQHAALKAAGAERVFSEKVSGVVTDRRQLAKAIAALNEGDVLVVSKLDRLARSLRDLLVTPLRSHREGRGVQGPGQSNARHHKPLRQALAERGRGYRRIRARVDPNSVR